MSSDPETLRQYASILEKPRRYFKNEPLHPPTDIEKAAAAALRFQADAIDAKLGLKYDEFRRSDNVEDNRDPSQPVDDRFWPSGQTLDLFESQLARDAGAKDIKK